MAFSPFQATSDKVAIVQESVRRTVRKCLQKSTPL